MALFVGQYPVGALRRIEEYAASLVVLRIVAVTFQPVFHVGQARHRGDLDALLETKLFRRYRAIHPIGQPVVALLLRLDDRGGMHARARPERVGPHHRIVHGNRHTDRVRDEPAILGQLANVSLVRAEELEIYDQKIHFGVADPFAASERRRMPAIHARLDRGETVDQPHAAIAVTVPVDFHVVLFDDFFFHEFDERSNTVWSCMPNRIRETDSPRAARDGRTIQRLDRLGPGAGCVLRDVHDRQAVLHRVGDGLFGRGNDAVQRPILRVLPDRGGADERGGFDLDPDLVGNADDRLDIGDDGPGGAIGGDGELVVADLFGQRPHLIDDARTGARQADIGGHDAEGRHQVQQPLFDVERRIRDRRRLQAIAQRLVVQINPGARPIEAAVYARAVPVVDKLALLHAFRVPRTLS